MPGTQLLGEDFEFLQTMRSKKSSLSSDRRTHRGQGPGNRVDFGATKFKVQSYLNIVITGGARSPRKRVCAGKFPANRENNRDNLKIGPFLSKIKTERFELSDGWAINSLRVRAGNKCAVTGN
jgi:hypothetical protein